MPRRRAASDSFADCVRDQLRDLGPVRLRRMFGGYGMYAGPAFFGILHGDRVYFKTDDAARPDYVARGMEPFRPNAKQTLVSYYEVPPEVLEDAQALVSWARRALAAAARPAARRRRSKTVRSRR